MKGKKSRLNASNEHADTNIEKMETVASWISEALVLDTIKLFRRHYGEVFNDKDAAATLASVGSLVDVLIQ